MLTRNADIRKELGWTAAKIAKIKAASTWEERVDLLLKMLQPDYVLETQLPLGATVEAVMANWGAKQDRSGPFQSVTHDIPAGKDQIQVAVDTDAIPDNGQSVEVGFFAQYFEDGPFEPAGAVVLAHGDNLNKLGADVGFKALFTLDNDGRYPIAGYVAGTVTGMLNCGFEIDYLPAGQ